MKLTVLGSSPVRPNPGAACSGYLLEVAGRQFLLDCGTGVLGQLLRHTTLSELEAVFLTHAHPDHCLDLVNLRQSLAHAPDAERNTPLKVYTSRETQATLDALGEVFSNGEDYWEGWLRFEEIQSGRRLELGELSVSFAETVHYLPCLAMRFDHAGRALVYAADSGPAEALIGFAENADLLIAEATLAKRNGHPDAWGHMSAAEAGALADATGAKKLLLTHYFASMQAALLEAARSHCHVEVGLAIEGEAHVL